MDLSEERWAALTPDGREALAKSLVRQLPFGFAFQSVRCCQLGEQRNDVAFFQNGEAFFAFIPGIAVVLGFDVDRPWEPNPDESESWLSTAAEYGIPETIEEHVIAATLRPRRVELAPFLIETTARELGWESIDLQDPEVQEILRKYPKTSVEVRHGEATIRVQRSLTGEITVERALSRTHADLAETTFRFPTSDEWEYTCGAGASTLFRWGDHVPCDRYPTDLSPAEAAWRRQWALSAGKLERPAAGFVSDWELHRQPNAFGLHVASDPYKYELVAEPGIFRGGDGGANICGGTGFFAGWLTLATSYFEEHSCRYDPDEPLLPGFTIGRRVLELR